MEQLSLKTLALAGLTALTLNGTAVITAGPAEAQGRGGYEEIDAPGDDLDGPRIRRGVDVDEDDELPPVRRRVMEPRVLDPPEQGRGNHLGDFVLNREHVVESFGEAAAFASATPR